MLFSSFRFTFNVSCPVPAPEFEVIPLILKGTSSLLPLLASADLEHHTSASFSDDVSCCHWPYALAAILRCFGKVSRVWSCGSDVLRWITLRNLKRSQKHETMLKPNPSTIPTACTVDASVFCIARTACSWDFVVQWCAEVLRKDRKAEVPDCTALNCHGSSCSSKQTQQNDSSWTTSIESTVASHRSRIREPEIRCAPCLKAHLNFQFHLFSDLGHLSSSQQKPRDSVLLV